MMNPLTELDIFDLADSTYPIIQEHMTYHILHFLNNSPEFDLKTYQHKRDDSLKAYFLDLLSLSLMCLSG
jgi:hypothetical protein